MSPAGISMFYGASDAYTALAEVGAHNTRQHAVVGEFRPGRDVLVLATSGSGQGDWKWCSQCQGRFFAGGNTLGVCPAGDAHSDAGSGDYALGQGDAYLATSSGGQSEWKWCDKCQGLFFSGGNTLGVCPAKGAHNDAGSGDYLLATSGGGRVPDARCRCSRRRCVLASVTRGRFGR
jgi:hypothetical protein